MKNLTHRKESLLGFSKGIFSRVEDLTALVLFVHTQVENMLSSVMRHAQICSYYKGFHCFGRYKCALVVSSSSQWLAHGKIFVGTM